jgi:hypothetical protein
VLRRLLILAAVPLALLVAADYGLRLYSQSVVGDEIRSALHLSESPSVSLGGWPFIPHLFSGDLPSASFSAENFEAQNVRLHRVTVDLEDVTFPAKRLLSSGRGTIRAARGHGQAVLTGENATDALHRAGLPLTVTIVDGHASVKAGGLNVGLSVELHGSFLVLTPAAVRIASARIALPTILRGLKYTGVQLEGSEAVVSFRVRHPVFAIS